MISFASVLWHINYCRLFNAKSSLYIYIKNMWFLLFVFYGISTIVGYLMPNFLYTYISNIYDLVWFGLVLWHINNCRSFNPKSFLYNTSNIYDLVWFGLVLWHINYCTLFKAKSSLNRYIKYIRFDWVGFYGTIVDYLMPNPFLYIYWIYIIWFGSVLWHIKHCRLFNAKSALYIYIYI